MYINFFIFIIILKRNSTHTVNYYYLSVVM